MASSVTVMVKHNASGILLLQYVATEKICFSFNNTTELNSNFFWTKRAGTEFKRDFKQNKLKFHSWVNFEWKVVGTIARTIYTRLPYLNIDSECQVQCSGRRCLCRWWSGTSCIITPNSELGCIKENVCCGYIVVRHFVQHLCIQFVRVVVRTGCTLCSCDTSY